jgi:hypothetical protein
MLESVAEAVADGMPVDWEGLLAAEPGLAEKLETLRLLQDLIAAHEDMRPPRIESRNPPR